MAGMTERATFRLKTGLAEMLKGGVIMDVVTPEEAKIAEEAGACAVMALERVPADIRRDGGVARMSDPAMIRSKGEAGTGNVVEAVRHMREITSGIKRLAQLRPEELSAEAKEHQAPMEVVQEVAKAGRLPVPLFCAGGIATPADAALMMQLGAEGNFVGSGIFKSADPERRARAIVEATTHFNDPERVAAASIGLGEAMPGLEIADLAAEDALLQNRGA